jgi:uncharacterized protein
MRTMATPGAAPDPRLARGVAAFNAGDYYGAHELFEELWNDSEGEARRLVQALVQLAAGYHKHEIGVPGGARKLLARALATLGDVPQAATPLAIAPVQTAVRRDLDRLHAATAGVTLAAPRLTLVAREAAP